MKLKVNNDGVWGSSDGGRKEIRNPNSWGGPPAEIRRPKESTKGQVVSQREAGRKENCGQRGLEVASDCPAGIYAVLAALARAAQGMTLAPPAGLLAAWFAVGTLFVTKVAYSGVGKLWERYAEDRNGAVRK
jgi:hypothetical protein